MRSTGYLYQIKDQKVYPNDRLLPQSVREICGRSANAYQGCIGRNMWQICECVSRMHRTEEDQNEKTYIKADESAVRPKGRCAY